MEVDPVPNVPTAPHFPQANTAENVQQPKSGDLSNRSTFLLFISEI